MWQTRETAVQSVVLFTAMTAPGIGLPFSPGSYNPIGLAVASGDILVAENGADRIRSIPIDGSPAIISEIVSNPLGIDSARL